MGDGRTGGERWAVFGTAEEAARAVAAECLAVMAAVRREGRRPVLGLATGATPLPFYRELARSHREDGVSFAGVVTFNLDEYVGLESGHPESYRAYMEREFFSLVDILPGDGHLPCGTVDRDGEAAECARYEAAIAAAGGIDFQILGIGRTGHIGFNEPGAAEDGATHVEELDPVTRADAAAAFGGIDRVPRRAITMGCGTILGARRIRLMAWGASKAPVVKQALCGPVTREVPASFLQKHPDARFVLDRAAAADLMARDAEGGYGSP